MKVTLCIDFVVLYQIDFNIKLIFEALKIYLDQPLKHQHFIN